MIAVQYGQLYKTIFSVFKGNDQHFYEVFARFAKIWTSPNSGNYQKLQTKAAYTLLKSSV